MVNVIDGRVGGPEASEDAVSILDVETTRFKPDVLYFNSRRYGSVTPKTKVEDYLPRCCSTGQKAATGAKFWKVKLSSTAWPAV